MANLHAPTRPLVNRDTPYPPNVGNAPDALRAAKRTVAPAAATALEATAVALQNVQSSLNSLHAASRHNLPSIEQLYVTDNTGKVLAALGDFEYQGVVTPNYFSELHVGDPLNTGNPAQALFNAVGNRVTIGQNGIVEVLDPFGNDAAWIGAQADTLAVTGAANNGTGLIRLTVTGHTLATGDSAPVANVGGVPNATGIFTVTSIDANHVDLQNSVFSGAYTGGGTINRLLHITGAVNNGSGLIRIQAAVSHGYLTGDEVNVLSVGGVPNATGQWIVTVVDATHFDLQGSTFAGTYTSGGICLRYFAGMLVQTFAVGPSFPGYKLRAFADGSLRIQNAEIALSSTSGGVTSSISLDPSLAVITVESSLGSRMELKNGYLQCNAITGSGAVDPDGGQVTIELGMWQMYAPGIGAFSQSKLLDLYAYTGSSGYGPLVSLTEYRGTPTAPGATLLNDTLGGMIAWGFDGVGESDYSAGIRAVAAENHAVGAHGSKIILEVTPNGSTSPTNQMVFDGSFVNLASGYKVAGQQVVGARLAAVTAVSGSAGATYTSTERNLINNLVAAVNSLISRNQTHGLTS